MFNDPYDFIRMLLKERVSVKERGQRTVTGMLVAFDEHCNLLLKDAEELDVSSGEHEVTHVDMMYLRGDGVLAITKI